MCQNQNHSLRFTEAGGLAWYTQGIVAHFLREGFADRTDTPAQRKFFAVIVFSTVD